MKDSKIAYEELGLKNPLGRKIIKSELFWKLTALLDMLSHAFANAMEIPGSSTGEQR